MNTSDESGNIPHYTHKNLTEGTKPFREFKGGDLSSLRESRFNFLCATPSAKHIGSDVYLVDCHTSPGHLVFDSFALLNPEVVRA